MAMLIWSNSHSPLSLFNVCGLDMCSNMFWCFSIDLWCPHTGSSYPDPMVGASRSFLNRISELSSLEGETIRQEKRLKTKKTPKPPSWHSASSQPPSVRVQTGQAMPNNAEQNKGFMAPCSFQFLAVIACLSAVVFISCLVWLIYLL